MMSSAHSSAHSRPRFTHFLSISFATAEIKDNFLKFKNEVLNDQDLTDIDELLFQRPEKLHLTLLMLALHDDQDKLRAQECLQNCRDVIGDDLQVKLAGIKSMNDNSSAVNVLYARVDSERLQDIGNKLAKRFEDEQLVEKADDVKLHVTLMNTTFKERATRKRKRRKGFNARLLLEKYQDYYFGSLRVNEIHLSQLSGKAANGYYFAESILKLKEEEESGNQIQEN